MRKTTRQATSLRSPSPNTQSTGTRTRSTSTRGNATNKRSTSTAPRGPSARPKAPTSKSKYKGNNKSPKFGKRTERLTKLNGHINFEREGEKTNARKWATDVICCQCRQKFTLPFKPRNPEVYCDHCFNLKKKHDKIKRKNEE